MGIYVSTQISAGLEQVWSKTQDPGHPRRWDLRFTDIRYLPRAPWASPQRFAYETRLGFGLRVRGEGETVASRDRDGDRISSLRFWSDERHSLIRKGSGYWKYSGTEHGTGFLTRYEYRTRFGQIGTFLDLVFRPLMAWATAWSFDCLRLWIEKGIPPESSRDKSIAHFCCRLAVAFTWIWHGAVPKLINNDPFEAVQFERLGLPPDVAASLVQASGIAEILLGLATLILWRSPRLFLGMTATFALLGIGSLIAVPESLGYAFGTVSLTVCLVALCAAGYFSSRDLPSARNCDYSWRYQK